ncbi:MAG: two-component system response regulator [Candidatus Margulisiibacteriota bacterium]|nr:MAG: hypothetical protein A2X43_12735 [Candidatus Margulisbacteria bacterium GWD2_39_127]OGI02097.1 MAG: hypothetical protein A2X42_01350 [Candidatus Margulisbacteria bacterium GWF2_38_17]OGI10474.1 MAG: hypothetical protein A2X41_06850 [Candidatus Margulisbacteria bacterium GWE2_39_32]PZM79980.1 MAG: two-component system response regulator [Candidatus Margulisiibacteriota bacterium]HAR62447.1 two-component system response regulator [Candidatus Margulisiibacteriota bacterium]
MVLAKVFIVDDSEFMINLLIKNLETIGCEVIDKATDGMDAIEKYKNIADNVDLVTLDISMPKQDGIVTLQELLKINPKAKVIMISALGNKDEVKKAILLGAKHFIVKPFTPSIVKDVIKYVLNKRY